MNEESESDDFDTLYIFHRDSVFSKHMANFIIKDLVIPIISYVKEKYFIDISFNDLMISLCGGSDRIRTLEFKRKDPMDKECKRVLIHGIRKGLICGKRCKNASEYCSKKCKDMDNRKDDQFEKCGFGDLYKDNKNYVYTLSENMYLLIGKKKGTKLVKFTEKRKQKLSENYTFDKEVNIDKYILLHGSFNKMKEQKVYEYHRKINDKKVGFDETTESSSDELSEGFY